jgi:hypothetical protein
MDMPAHSFDSVSDAKDLRAEALAQPIAAAPHDNCFATHTLSKIISAHERRPLIVEAAHRRAARRGLTANANWQDWWAAECEVNAMLASDFDRDV